MNRLEQDAADSLVWHERQQRHKQGYGPRPPEKASGVWAPVLTEQQKQEFEQYSKEFSLPF